MKNLNQKNILLTGVTGLVGRHVLYELLLENIRNSSNNKIFVTIRATDKLPKDRLQDLFEAGTCPNSLMQYPFEYFLNFIEIVNTDLLSGNLDTLLQHKLPQNITVIHSAASTNLATNDAAKKEVFDNNMIATLHLIKAIAPISNKFCYISSSFAIGQKEGIIKDDYLSTNSGDSRNHYEQYKLKAEKSIVEYCEEHNIDWQILRPSIVSGRLIEAPLYYMSKFDVFYGFAKCAGFLAAKVNKSTPLRITCNEQSSLNIVPADYAAKVICKTIHTPIQQLNIVHENSVNSKILIDEIFKAVGLTNYQFVTEMPEHQSKEERFYYATAGALFTGYLCSPAQSFDVTRIHHLMQGTPLTQIDSALPKLLEFAVNCGFDSNLSNHQAIVMDSAKSDKNWDEFISTLNESNATAC